ncbi:MAG: AAA family ATPase [Phycisphaerales bacterium]
MAKVNVLKEIIDWSAERPDWQRDALRRLVVHGELETSEIDDLARICKASHGLTDAAETDPLARDHLPEPESAATPVSLASLTHHAGVNALAQDQTIAFGPNLTVVYGANAAGKSGYTRILKRACRARGAEAILGNVVSGTTPGRPSATIKYAVNGTEHEHRWDDDDPPHRELSRVSVFDRHCASVYITEQTDVAYRPLGLDLFDKLSGACEAVRRVLDGERKELEAAAAHLPEVSEGTKVHMMLSRLTSLTKADDVKALGSLTEEELEKLEQLRKRLRDLHSDDPQKTARTLEIRAKRMEGLASRIRKIGELLSDEAVGKAFTARARMMEARTAAETMRREAFEAQPLPNTGSDAWRILWAAAERFSDEDAYPDDTFPVTEADARCVLCQQQLRDEAVKRFKRFHDFLNSQVQRERDQASAAFEQRRKEFRGLTIADDATAEVLDELQLEAAEIAKAVRAYLEAAQHRLVDLMNALGVESASASGLSSLPDAHDQLYEHLEELRARVSELRGTDRTAKIKEIEVELRELEARQILGKHLDVVLSEIERKKRIAAYQLCIDETNTRAITVKSTEVTKSAVTEQLASSFKKELELLKFRHVEVEMIAAGGSRGALYHKLQLRRAPGVSVPKVVSEGEARCLSIASFFAELSTADDRSAILFDDPVSSLDHNWRSSVAERLVQESETRQVIVFTHDIVFLLSLAEHADKQTVDLKHQCLRRVPSNAGLCEESLPWAAMKVSARIGHLKQLAQETGALYRNGNQSEYEQKAAYIYGLLREAWERAVEEVLLNGVVERYRNSVETNRAKNLGDICEEDCKALNDGMTKCSRWLPGHDQAAAEGAAFPEPSELEQDIKSLDDWVKAIRNRRK